MSDNSIYNQKPIQKLGIDLSKFTEDEKKKFMELSENFEYGKQIFLLDDERFN